MTNTNEEQPTSAIDQIIQQAMREGKFTNLPGERQPQVFDDDNVPEDMRLAYRMLKGNDYAPPWIESLKDIEQERAAVNAWLAETNARWHRLPEPLRQAARAEFRQKLTDLRRSILTHNLKVPGGVGQIPNIQIEAEIKRLGV